MKNIIIGLVIGLLVGVGFGYVIQRSSVVAGAPSNLSSLSSNTLTVGTGCDNEFTTCVSTLTVDSTGTTTIAGSLFENGDTTWASTNSTTTPANLTLQQNDIIFENLIDTPTVGNITLTLPATSTLTALIPTPGQSTFLFIANATTTTSGVGIITIAGNTGENITVATGTVSSTIAINPKKTALLRFIRMPNSDIDVEMMPGI